ncbi:MAG: MBL fold metallo-hydrolase [Kosmotoga sp.]|nr:MAG: MBL fold metallo-hydrolase [Kosmotoga sp.]
MEFKIFSKALYSTWIYYRPERLLFDTGEGISTNMGNEVYAIKEIFLTHGHIDHISGLWGIINTRNNAMGDKTKPLRITYPKNNRAIESYIQFIKQMNPYLKYDILLNPVEEGEIVFLRYAGNFKRTVVPFKVKHTPGEISLGYNIVEERHKLKEMYKNKSSKEIAKISKKMGKEEVTYAYNKNIVTISGDTYALPLSIIENSETLLHECTFLKAEDRRGENHSSLEEILNNVLKVNGLKRLLLYHISSRYIGKWSKWRKYIEERMKDSNIKVHLVHPQKLFTL